MASKLPIFVFAAVAFVSATFVEAQTFPTSLQQCIDGGGCSTPALVQSSPLFERYRYSDEDNSLVHLLRYSIGGDSAFELTGEFATQTPYFGSAWLGLNDEYAIASGAHELTLYTEQIQPLASIFPVRQDITLTLSTDAIIAGAGSFLITDEGGQDGGLHSDGPIVCLSEGCFAGAEFNLLNVRYRASGDVVRATFTQAPIDGQLLYSERTGFPGLEPDQSMAFDQNSSFFVGPAIPEPGDYNADGSVDADDYSVWRAAFGTTEINSPADGNGDGVVDAADFTIWRDNLPRTATTTSVPEPTFGIVTLVAGIIILRRRRPALQF